MDNKTLTEHMFNISNKLTEIVTVVVKHDKETFPKIEKELLKQSDALYRMESKQNEDMARFIHEKEKMYKDIDTRLVKVEEDLSERQKTKTEVKSKISTIVWGGVEKISYVIIGYIITKIKYFQ